MGAVTTHKTMTVREWIAVTPNPIQRDTERHAAKAKHLMTPLPTHQFVFAAQMPGGQLIKLDGHTRALLWERNQVPAPQNVIVGIVQVRTQKEAEELYKTFDSKDALESMRDKVSGAFNRYGFEPRSALLQHGTIVSALRAAYAVLIGGTVKMVDAGKSQRRSPRQIAVGDADIYALVNEFSYELTALDGFMLRQGQITGGISAAFILSFRKYGSKVVPFWQGVFAGEGSKIKGEMDAIQAVSEMIDARKRRKGARPRSETADSCARALMAVEKWLRDETLYQMPRPLDTTGYLTGHETPQERLIKKADIAVRK